MSDPKYSPKSGGVDAPAAPPPAPIDLFADPNHQEPQLPPPSNDIYIGEVVSTGASSNMQPSVRPGHHSVIVTPANARNNIPFTYQQEEPHHHNPRSAAYQNQPQHFLGHDAAAAAGAPRTTSLADTPLPENVQQEWDAVTEVTVLSSRLRILYVCELLEIIVNAIVFPWSCFAIPFCIAGYVAVRWFKYYFGVAGMVTFLMMVPITIATAILTETDGGFEAFAFVVICILAIFWHLFIGWTTYKFLVALKKLSPENLEQVQREMPLVCGCL